MADRKDVIQGTLDLLVLRIIAAQAAARRGQGEADRGRRFGARLRAVDRQRLAAQHAAGTARRCGRCSRRRWRVYRRR